MKTETLDNRVRVTMTGDVYMFVPNEAARLFMDGGYGYDIYEFDEKDMPVEAESCSEDSELYVRVGSIISFYKEREKQITSFDDVKRYVETYGMFPWGIKTLCKNNVWSRYCEKGASVALIDSNGRTMRFNKKFNTVDIDDKVAS